MREKSGGTMEGLPLAAFRNASKEANMDIRDFSAPEGERWKDVNLRAKDFLHNDIYAHWQYKLYPFLNYMLHRYEQIYYHLLR